ncbi:hypothetical protein [Kineosporia sp. NBRC 101731]|uniref:hypothetical protein n=1 Tax=Kineosporia sp. NBRC 101731 TaxID=3032199 RepID=UPI0024A47303|nr:hypothetical protein [Kineosporia sp. NBRC 101731]GLY33595.1 hypothetical protein Kisp02_69600 [Kineosporia sp. NBRC 101731]
MQEQVALKGERPDTGEWVGRVEVDLRNARDWSVGSLHLEVEPGTVTVWFGSRALAVMNRDELREWIIHPRGVRLAADDLVWSTQYGSTYVAIGWTAEYRLGDSSLRELMAVI